MFSTLAMDRLYHNHIFYNINKPNIVNMFSMNPCLQKSTMTNLTRKNSKCSLSFFYFKVSKKFRGRLMGILKKKGIKNILIKKECKMYSSFPRA